MVFILRFIYLIIALLGLFGLPTLVVMKGILPAMKKTHIMARIVVGVAVWAVIAVIMAMILTFILASVVTFEQTSGGCLGFSCHF